MKLEDYGKKTYDHEYVFTPDQKKYKTDMSPSGRLINFVLQEAPDLSLEALKLHQLEDPVFAPIIKKIYETGRPYMDFLLKDDILIKEDTQADLEPAYIISVPKSLSLELIGKFHYSIFESHPDLRKMMSNLKRRFYIKKNDEIMPTYHTELQNLYRQQEFQYSTTTIWYNESQWTTASICFRYLHC